MGENQEPASPPAGIRDCHMDVITVRVSGLRAVNTFYYSIKKYMKAAVLFRKLISKHPIESV